MAFKLSDDLLMMVGIVVLAMFIACDLYKAYKRGAKWLPGHFLLFCGLTVQLLGYLDIQRLRFGSRHNEHDLEVLIAKQLSIDSSRLILIVFVGYLLPGLASAGRLWSNIAALSVSLTSHVAIELLAVQTDVNEKDNLIKGQSGIWLIAYYYVLLCSILGLLFLFVWAIGNGRFIRDNLSSRIQSVLSGSDNKEVSNWETYEYEILKSWIVARVCQPEYVLGRTVFSAGVGIVMTNCVGVFTAKVICLRSHLHGAHPLLTLQFIFIIVGWFAVMYRWYSAVIYFRDSQILRNFRFNIFYIFIFDILPNLFRSFRRVPLLLQIPIVILCLSLCLIICLIFSGFLAALSLYVFICGLSWSLSVLIMRNKFVEKLCIVQMKPGCERVFNKYEQILKRLCGPKEDPKGLWVANESSFKEIKDRIKEGYRRGGRCKTLITVIGSKVSGNYVERVGQLLEPLESVKEYFPLLKDSFRRITVRSLLFIVSTLASHDHVSPPHYLPISEEDKEAWELMDFVDCPDGVGINVDVLSTKNVEAFEVRLGSGGPLKREFVDLLSKEFKKTSTIDDILDLIGKLQNKAKALLEKPDNPQDLAEKPPNPQDLLEEQPNAEVLNTNWASAAKNYGMYKVCKIIVESPRPDTVQNLVDELSHLLAELIARCVDESQEILLRRTKEWAKNFKEGKITAAIEIGGFAWGVKDAAQKSNEGSAMLV